MRENTGTTNVKDGGKLQIMRDSSKMTCAMDGVGSQMQTKYIKDIFWTVSSMV